MAPVRTGKGAVRSSMGFRRLQAMRLHPSRLARPSISKLPAPVQRIRQVDHHHLRLPMTTQSMASRAGFLLVSRRVVSIAAINFVNPSRFVVEQPEELPVRLPVIDHVPEGRRCRSFLMVS